MSGGVRVGDWIFPDPQRLKQVLLTYLGLLRDVAVIHCGHNKLPR